MALRGDHRSAIGVTSELPLRDQTYLPSGKTCAGSDKLAGPKAYASYKPNSKRHYELTSGQQRARV